VEDEGQAMCRLATRVSRMRSQGADCGGRRTARAAVASRWLKELESWASRPGGGASYWVVGVPKGPKIVNF